MTSIYQSGWAGRGAVSAAAIGFGLSPFFATKAFASGVSPLAASAIRVTALLVVLAPFAPRVRGWTREAAIAAGGGAISMLGFAGFFIALNQAPVEAATVVYYTYPVAVLALSAAFRRQRLLPWEIVACAVVLIGVIFAVGPIGISTAMLLALAPAFAAPVGWAIYLLILSGPVAAMPTLPKVFAGALGGSLALMPIALWDTAGALMPRTAEAATSMGLLTLCSLAIPAVLISWGAGRTGERSTAMIGTLEFVVAVGAGCLLLGHRLSIPQICGVSLVLGAVLYAATRQADLTPTPGPTPELKPQSWIQAEQVDVANCRIPGRNRSRPVPVAELH